MLKDNIEPVKILHVEDSESDILLLKEIFEEAKIRNKFTVVHDGASALKFLRKEGKYSDREIPDLIILDLNIPEINGHEVLAELKSNKELSYIPVVVLTTSNSLEDVKKAYKNHANCFITKPMSLDDFVEIVRSIEHFWFSIVRLPR